MIKNLIWFFWLGGVIIYSFKKIFLAVLIVFLLFSITSVSASDSDDLKDKDKLLTLCRNANLTKNATDRMILKYIEGKSYREIAEMECVDIQTIKISINRSRNKIFKN